VKAVVTGLAVLILVGIGIGLAMSRVAPDSAVPDDWPAAKAAHMRAEDQLRRAAEGRPVRAVGQAPASAGRAALTQGIMPLADGGPFRPWQFQGTNLWNGRVGARWEVVQAGGVPSDGPNAVWGPATSAGLFVYTRSPDPASPAAPKVIGIRVPSPAPRGMFTVRSVSGRRLTLSLPGSRAPYYFDVVTLRFTR
jgi:hypothetical protein